MLAPVEGRRDYIGGMETAPVGRPPVSRLTESLLDAAERIMTTVGYSGLTVDGLVTAIGTTRPTFYRRFPNIAHLALTVLKNHFGTGTPVNTGSLRDDLLALQTAEIEMFASPLLRKNLGGLLEAARADPPLLSLYSSEFIGPRRENLARVLESAVERGDVRDGEVDVDFVCDLLLGPILARALVPGAGELNELLAHQTTDAALLVLGVSAEPELNG